jgi:hypothetical protein
MMRADYDSEADALAITLRPFRFYDDQEEVDDDYCVVGFAGGGPVRVSLLDPAKHLDLLDAAAERYELDGIALRAAATAALAAPDRVVTMELSAPIAA